MAGNNSIQFLRGNIERINSAVANNVELLDGQPLYDTERNFLIVGGGNNNVNKPPIACQEMKIYSGNSTTLGNTVIGSIKLTNRSNVSDLAASSSSIRLLGSGNVVLNAPTINIGNNSNVYLKGNNTSIEGGNISVKESSSLTANAPTIDVSTGNISLHSYTGNSSIYLGSSGNSGVVGISGSSIGISGNLTVIGCAATDGCIGMFTRYGNISIASAGGNLSLNSTGMSLKNASTSLYVSRYSIDMYASNPTYGDGKISLKTDEEGGSILLESYVKDTIPTTNRFRDIDLHGCVYVYNQLNQKLTLADYIRLVVANGSVNQ